MKKYFVEEVKCGVSEEVIDCCGPHDPFVVTSIKYNDGKKSQWLTLLEIDGYPGFYVSKVDIYDKLLANAASTDDDFSNLLDKSAIEKFDGVNLGLYEDIFENLLKKEKTDTAKLLRYIISVTRCTMSEMEYLIGLGKDHYISEVDFPRSDVEDEFLDELLENNYEM